MTTTKKTAKAAAVAGSESRIEMDGYWHPGPPPRLMDRRIVLHSARRPVGVIAGLELGDTICEGDPPQPYEVNHFIGSQDSESTVTIYRRADPPRNASKAEVKARKALPLYVVHIELNSDEHGRYYGAESFHGVFECLQFVLPAFHLVALGPPC